jgi:hypothetical protein
MTSSSATSKAPPASASRRPGAPAAPWWEGLAALGAHAGGRRSGLASLERDPDAGRDREQEWPVTAVLVEPAVGEFPDLSAPGLLELGRRSQPSSGTRSSGFRPGGVVHRWSFASPASYQTLAIASSGAPSQRGSPDNRADFSSRAVGSQICQRLCADLHVERSCLRRLDVRYGSRSRPAAPPAGCRCCRTHRDIAWSLLSELVDEFEADADQHGYVLGFRQESDDILGDLLSGSGTLR